MIDVIVIRRASRRERAIGFRRWRIASVTEQSVNENRGAELRSCAGRENRVEQIDLAAGDADVVGEFSGAIEASFHVNLAADKWTKIFVHVGFRRRRMTTGYRRDNRENERKMQSGSCHVIRRGR